MLQLAGFLKEEEREIRTHAIDTLLKTEVIERIKAAETSVLSSQNHHAHLQATKILAKEAFEFETFTSMREAGCAAHRPVRVCKQ